MTSKQFKRKTPLWKRVLKVIAIPFAGPFLLILIVIAPLIGIAQGLWERDYQAVSECLGVLLYIAVGLVILSLLGLLIG